MIAFAALVALAGFLFTRLPTSFLPEEDQGYAFVIVQLPPGANMERTGQVLREMEAILKKNPAVDQVLDVAGFSFVGPTIVYAFMQAVGMVNDHLVTCFRHDECQALPPTSPPLS